MESGQKFFTAKNLIFLNKQIKAMYRKNYWPTLDKALPSIARSWCDDFSNFRISDDLRVLNAEFLDYMRNYFQTQLRDAPGTSLFNVYTPEQTRENDKYSGEFMDVKDPFLEYQATQFQPIVADNKTMKKSHNLYHDLKLGDMPVYGLLNDEEKFFLNSAFDIGAKSQRRTNKDTKDKKIVEPFIKDSLVTGHPRTFYKVNERNIDLFERNEKQYFDRFDPVGPGTVYDCKGVVGMKYTKDPTPYNVAGTNLVNSHYDRPTTVLYAGARY